jgi:SH3 domain protein
LKSRIAITRSLTLALVACITPALLPAQAVAQTTTAETVYISDALTVPLRSGPSNAYRILHRGLPSGTRMEVVSRDEESGFTQIRTARGAEGWIPSQYLVTEPIARERLVVANREIQRMNGLLQEQESQLGSLNREKGDAQQSSAGLQQQVTALEKELADIKQISAGAIEEHATNQRLAELNERLRDEITNLALERDGLQDNAQQRWLLTGAGLVLLGLALGVVIKARPRRSAWN